MLEVLGRWDGEAAGVQRGAPVARQAPPPDRSEQPLTLPKADAFFNQDANALRALLADDVVQHAGAWQQGLCPVALAIAGVAPAPAWTPG